MEQERLTHRLIAAIIFLVTLTFYCLTIAPTTSFWDCGEFIACSYIMGIPHPPGTPFYLLLGRIFSMIPWAADIGLRVNLISAISTALTIMLTYLIIVRLIVLWRGAVKTLEDRIILYGGAIIGSLAFAFSDSLWFNAVEAEVYAISMFFTAIIVWLILVWHEKADDPASDKYIFLIAYCIGLAIGIHLLNILALPAIFLIYYFRKSKVNLKSLVLLIVVSFSIFFIIYPGIVKGLPNLALVLKNNFGAAVAAFFFVLLLIAIVLLTVFAAKNRSRALFVSVMSIILILLGTSTFTSIYIRSNLNPAIDQNDPENLENFVSYINREQYGDWSIIERRAPLWEYQIKKMYLRYLGWQFMGKGSVMGADGFLTETFSLQGLWGIPFLLGIMGMVHHFFKDFRRALSILLLFFMTGLAIVIYLNQPDPQPRERDYVFVASFFAYAIWIGIGVAGILESIVESIRSNSWLRRTVMALVAVIIFALVPINMLAFNYHTHDRSGNYVAYDYSYNLLQSCEPNAILFTNGDNDTFPLWFLQYVKGIRRDVRVANLSLLNTDWYIKQLRDQEPRVPINLSDVQIDNLAATYWPDKKIVKIEVPPQIYEQEREDLELRKEFIDKTVTSAPEITFELGPTFMGQAIRVQDIMILNIIASNQFKKPIYFAVTVSPDNMLNLDDYLRMDGLVYKLVTYPGDRISPSRLRENFFNRFSYRNLNNPDVYYDDNIIGLIINYRSGFMRLANFYRQEKMYDDMLLTLDKMSEMIPEEVIPIHDRRIAFGIGQMYLEGGHPEKFEKRIDFWFNQPDLSADEQLEFAQIYYQYVNNHVRSEEIVSDLIKHNPNYLRGYYWLFNLYSGTKAYAKGIDLANQLLQINPNDSQAKVRLSQFRMLLDSAERANTLP